MPSILITALLGLAAITGSVSGVALAQDSIPAVKPCVGELCPPKSPRQDLPDQRTKPQGQVQSSTQVISRKKKRMGSQQPDVRAARSYHISCAEGRAIVAQRFNRVRVIECRGGIYTYRGRRHGETFQIRLNSRSGRIMARMPI
jgi:hypothetical protein